VGAEGGTLTACKAAARACSMGGAEGTSVAECDGGSWKAACVVAASGSGSRPGVMVAWRAWLGCGG
jgi:hypothetical protein